MTRIMLTPLLLVAACARSGVSPEADSFSDQSCPSEARSERFWSQQGALGEGFRLQGCPGEACRFELTLSFFDLSLISETATEVVLVGAVEEYASSSERVSVLQLDGPWALAFGQPERWENLEQMGVRDLRVSLPKRLLGGWSTRSHGLRHCTSAEPRPGPVGRLALSGADGTQNWSTGRLSLFNWRTRETLAILAR